ncbi:MAG: DNA ligase D [Gemmatimonadota bacterium]|nr:MAG: DNA ligase D [Gemmatimonadota bacterium]
MPARKEAATDRLTAYRAKRSADRTPEPFASGSSIGGQLFVVQQHAARRVHYDLRLEMDGVLVSWAVPKGPSPNPADKRLAVHAEDHPVEYGDFEGIIPEGNYGAGAVIVWDQGVWTPLEDPAAGLEKGKLLFELRGYKLHGKWTLVKTKRDWLLIKERDTYVSDDGTESYPADSVFSGLTVEQLRDGVDRAQRVRQRLIAFGAPRSAVTPSRTKVMLAETSREPFSRSGWLFEIKYDGYRLIAGRDAGTAVLRSRAGNDLTATFPDIAKAVERLPYDNFALDGEVVVHDDNGLPSFQRLQKRGRLSRRLEIQRAAAEHPATLYAFDLVGFSGFDLRPLPLETRKSLLREILPTVGPLRYSEHIAEQGAAMFEQVQRMRLEGIVAKKVDSPYRAGRSPDWVKIRADRTDDFVVIGFTDRKGSRGGFGALHVAQYRDGDLVYAGRVGTGFTEAQLDEVRDQLDERLRDEPPCSGPVPRGKQNHWVEPEMVCEIRFREMTEDGLLRHPAFLRFRDDKAPEDCLLEVHPSHVPEPIVAAESSTDERTITFTNLDKVFWPDERYTKGDLIEYYRSVSDWLLPYLKNRPVVMTRYPDGIEGKSFFQKDAPKFAPDWITRLRLWSEGSERELDYFVADDLESLLYIINLGTIPLHIWSSHVAALETPDWCVLDLDPKEAPFSDVVKIARALRSLCHEIELPSFIKTSGSSGLHVLIPLGHQCTYEQSRTLGQLLARVIVAELPEIATVTRIPSKREGKVYIDYVQNGHGRLLVSPFCVRPLPGAPVSTPLKWSEVNARLDIGKHTVKSVPTRMRRLKTDPMVEVLSFKPDLNHALNLLTRKFE